MGYEERITEIEIEISEFDYKRLKLQEQIQQTQAALQQELSDVSRGILTRQGEIIGLKRLMVEKE